MMKGGYSIWSSWKKEREGESKWIAEGKKINKKRENKTKL